MNKILLFTLSPLDPLIPISFLSRGIITLHVLVLLCLQPMMCFYYYCTIFTILHCLDLNHSSYTLIYIANMGIKTRVLQQTL